MQEINKIYMDKEANLRRKLIKGADDLNLLRIEWYNILLIVSTKCIIGYVFV